MGRRSGDDVEEFLHFKSTLAHRLSNATQALEIRLGVMAPEIVIGNPVLRAAAEAVEEINGLVCELRDLHMPSAIKQET